MHRLTTTAATCAAAFLLALALPGSAYAANGAVLLDGSTYPNPSGCITPGNNPHQSLDIDNRTDEPLSIYDTRDCSGNPNSAISPGTTGSFSGASVLAP